MRWKMNDKYYFFLSHLIGLIHSGKINDTIIVASGKNEVDKIVAYLRRKSVSDYRIKGAKLTFEIGNTKKMEVIL